MQLTKFPERPLENLPVSEINVIVNEAQYNKAPCNNLAFSSTA